MTNDLGSGLFGKAREAILGLLFTAGKPLHVREIARRTNFSAPSVATELRNLERLGVLRSATIGRQLEYSPNPACPLYPELASIAVKTWGLRGRIAQAIEKVTGIDVAFIFGSIAAGTAHSGSDVDLLVLGSADYAVLSNALLDVSTEIGRPVNGALYRPAEWSRKLASGNAFVQDVLAKPKLFVIGDEEDLHAVAGTGKAGRAQAAEPSQSHAGGARKPPAARKTALRRVRTKRRS